MASGDQDAAPGAEGDRERLIAQVLAGGRELSTAAVMFHTALAGHHGLSASEEKTLGYLQSGPRTAGELAKESGLAPSSITDLVGRLERKGAVRRVTHPDDGRRVLVELEQGWIAGLAPLFDEFVGALTELCERYTDEQLATIADFLVSSAHTQQESTARLTDDPAP